ncbi:MAG TPA: carbon-nitrogen hydrolase [Ignavibacteriaceae bacterium]|nr:carbon-nitrogen hydrolase [Ignavibacteriaceae bacterium]
MNVKKKFTAGLLQLKMESSPERNLKNALSWIDKAAKEGAEVICLPELFRSRYFCQEENTDNFNLAETIPGPSTEAACIAAKGNNVVVIVPLFEKRKTGVYHNSLVVINNSGEIAGVYRKMHIPDDPAYYEKYYFTPGDLGYKSFSTEFGNIGTLICWDQWYPESARITALKGADILFYPTAIGWHPHEKKEHGAAQLDSWRTIQRSHAIANGIYVAAVNRVGLEKLTGNSEGIEFWGSSFISDPQGIVIAQGSENQEEIILGEIDLERIEYIRHNWPFLRDRRIDSYVDINKRLIDE